MVNLSRSRKASKIDVGEKRITGNWVCHGIQ